MKRIMRIVLIIVCFAPAVNCTLNNPPESFLRELLLLRPCVPFQMGGSLQGCRLNLAGRVTTLAGDGTSSFADGTGTAAQFSGSNGIATDGINLYLADTSNRRIRKIEIATAIVTTIAGDGSTGSTDGPGVGASFSDPRGLTTDGTALYVADGGNHRIRKIDIASGVVTTLAGSSPGFLDATGTAAMFNDPRSITTDRDSVYVADRVNNRIRKIDIATGVVTTVAGDGTVAFQDGIGTAAQFSGPQGVGTDGRYLYVGDIGNQRVRRIEIATGVVTTVAGDGTAAFRDGTGTGAQFNAPFTIGTDGSDLYVPDGSNFRVRRIETATELVTTVAGNGTNTFLDGVGSAAQFTGPRRITTDGVNLYVADSNRIRKIE